MKALAFLFLLLLLAGVAVSARAEYQFQALGTFDHLLGEATGIDDLGRVTGLLTGA